MVIEQAKKTIEKTATATKKISSAKARGAAAGKTSKTSLATAVKKAAVKTTKVETTKASAAKTVTVRAKKSPRAAPSASKPANKAKAPASSTAQPTPEERYRMVEVAAYYIAERNGFQGSAVAHWETAEREISARLGQ